MIDDVHARSECHREAAIPPEDSELLRRYAEDGSEAAFAELVRRRIGLVHSVALRQAHGDHHRAEDATQAVFTDLAAKAALLSRRLVLAGWLHRSAEYAAARLVRVECRRRAREQKAYIMEDNLASDNAEADWEKFRPVLDQALNELTEHERDAILLRFIDRRPFAEIGARFRLSENTARMRVERALHKLGAALARRGITSTSAALGVALGHHTVGAPPLGLAATVVSAALANAAAAPAAGGLLTFMALNKLQLEFAAAVVLTSATGIVLQKQTHTELREEIAAQQVSLQQISALRTENQRLSSIATHCSQRCRIDHAAG